MGVWKQDETSHTAPLPGFPEKTAARCPHCPDERPQGEHNVSADQKKMNWPWRNGWQKMAAPPERVRTPCRERDAATSPISSRTTVLAVAGLGLPPGSTSPLNEADSKNLMLALAGECALAVEKERLARANADIAVHAQQEKLRADVLRSVSHDLRTPLTAICGNAAVLASENDMETQRPKSLARAIEEDTRYLVEMVENLLSLTRLEQYGFTLRLTPELAEDIIREAVNATRPTGGGRQRARHFR